MIRILNFCRFEHFRFFIFDLRSLEFAEIDEKYFENVKLLRPTKHRHAFSPSRKNNYHEYLSNSKYILYSIFLFLYFSILCIVYSIYVRKKLFKYFHNSIPLSILLCTLYSIYFYIYSYYTHIIYILF